MPGPSADLFGALEKALGGLPFVAEDLGIITPDVSALRDAFHIPGTRVLQFAFDGHSDNPYLPRNYVPNTVVYTGTHDNPTTRGWYEDLPDAERAHLWSYLGRGADSSEGVCPSPCWVWRGRRSLRSRSRRCRTYSTWARRRE